MEDGKLKEREHKIKLYQMPQLMPPNVDYSRAKELSAKTQIVINLERIPYTEKDLRRARDAKKKRKRPDQEYYILNNYLFSSHQKYLFLNNSLNHSFLISTSYGADTSMTKNRGNTANNNQNAFIENVEQQWNSQSIYTRNMGVDVYVDGMRFLPDRVTVTKILMDVVNNQFQEVFK